MRNHKKSLQILKWRNAEFIIDREYRKVMGETFYECNDSEKIE